MVDPVGTVMTCSPLGVSVITSSLSSASPVICSSPEGVTVAVRAPAAEAAGITRLAATNAVTTINRRTVRIIVPLPPGLPGHHSTTQCGRMVS